MFLHSIILPTHDERTNKKVNNAFHFWLLFIPIKALRKKIQTTSIIAAERLLQCKLNIKEKKKKKKLLVLQPLQHIAECTDNTLVIKRRYVFLSQQQQIWKKSSTATVAM